MEINSGSAELVCSCGYWFGIGETPEKHNDASIGYMSQHEARLLITLSRLVKKITREG